MEFLEGETLADRIAKGSNAGAVGPPVDEALQIAIQIADALDNAHRAGVVHRDLKPANIMLTRGAGSASASRARAAAHAKLLDFGLAKTGPAAPAAGLSMLPTTPPNVTAQGTILGTFQYMAPEQIEGLEADARTDIFAFGAVLFEMLTGRTAFEGKTRASLLGAILKDEPPRVSTVQPLAPKALDRIVATCLAKDPDDRYQTARDLLRELKWIASGGDAVDAAQPVSRVAPARRGPAWALAGVLAVMVAAAGVIVVRHLREAPAAREPLQYTVAAPDNSSHAQTALQT